MVSSKLLASAARNLSSAVRTSQTKQQTALRPMIYKNCTSADYNQLMDAMINGFGKREPHCQVLGITIDEVYPLLEHIIAMSIHNPHTVKAIDPQLDKTVGFRVMSYGSRNNDPKFKNEGHPLETEKLTPNVRKLVDMLTDAYSILFDNTDFENILHCEAIFVDKSHASKGYANVLIEANLNWVELANSGLDAYTGVCTAPGSYHAAVYVGSKDIGRISEHYYKDLKFDNGWNKISAVAKDIRSFRTKKE